MKRDSIRRVRRMIAVLLVIAMIFGILFLWLVDWQIRPMLKMYGNNQAVTAATRAVNDAVDRVLSERSVKYEDLSAIVQNDQGEISTIKTNTANMNILKSAVSKAILEELNNQKMQKVDIPLGSLAGGLLTGRGPNIRVKIPMNSTVETDFSNKFESAGINQTRHDITLDVTVKIFTVIQGESKATEVKTGFTIAECILVGKVPSWMVATSQPQSAEK